jgi:hypothetical protein
MVCAKASDLAQGHTYRLYPPKKSQSGYGERTTAGQLFGTTKILLRVESDIH